MTSSYRRFAIDGRGLPTMLFAMSIGRRGFLFVVLLTVMPALPSAQDPT
jgi:hypothetical protein